MYGIISHRPWTFSLPNLCIYHCFVVCAVIPRLTATNAKQANMVLLITWPGGAANRASDKYIMHSAP